jgi:uncharacterized protein (TIGR03435 family)
MRRSLANHILLIALTLPIPAAFGQAAAPAQTPAAKPALAFEVASVKLAGPLDPQKIMSGQQRIGMESDNARVGLFSMTLNDLIMLAFKVKPYQVSGPNWLGSGLSAERFEIRATIPEGANKDQVPEMLQTLLAERFALQFHRDTVEHNIYALVVGKSGPKMKDALPDDAIEAQNAAPPQPGGGTSINLNGSQVKVEGNPQSGMVVRGGGNGMGPMKMTMSGTSMHMETPKMNMEMLTAMLSRFVDRPIVDKTDLKGFYQVALDLSMEEMMNAARASGAGPAMAMRGGAPGGAAEMASEPSGGSVFESVQRLGLKLEPRKAPVDRIVIDHLERKPTEN